MNLEDSDLKTCPKCGKESIFQPIGVDFSQLPVMEMTAFRCNDCDIEGFINLFYRKPNDERNLDNLQRN